MQALEQSVSFCITELEVVSVIVCQGGGCHIPDTTHANQSNKMWVTGAIQKHVGELIQSGEFRFPASEYGIPPEGHNEERLLRW